MRVVSKWVGFVGAALAVLAGLAATSCRSRSTGTVTDAAASASASAASATSTAPAASSAAPSMIASAEPVDMTVDVAELLRDYKGNELHGDNKYKGKRVRIIGKAGEFKRDITNTIYMTVGTGAQFEIPEAQCFFGDEYANAVASLTKGATVVVNCTVDGLMMNVLMKDCSFPSVATLNACYKLENAGIAKQCIPQNDPLEETASTRRSRRRTWPRTRRRTSRSDRSGSLSY